MWTIVIIFATILAVKYDDTFGNWYAVILVAIIVWGLFSGGGDDFDGNLDIDGD